MALDTTKFCFKLESWGVGGGVGGWGWGGGGGGGMLLPLQISLMDFEKVE